MPGPLIKWFLKTIGNEGLFEISNKLNDNQAEVKTIISYCKNQDEIYFFEGVLQGEIVKPKGENSFGWDVVFKSIGFDKTFAQMTNAKKIILVCEKLPLKN